MICCTDPELQDYAERLPGYDEAVGGDGAHSKAWRQVFRHFQLASAEDRRGWSGAIRRDLREDGLTFTISPTLPSPSRSEDLDPVPWLLNETDWAPVEAGLAQRARLLEQVARDLLGPRKLLRDGLLPADVLFAHAGYLRACAGLPANLGAYLFQYAADLARGPDGRMWVLDDKTQAPSGAGYALENRTILGRMFPDLLGSLRVRRLAGYFRQFRESLLNLHEGRRLDPRVVVLTPGPYSSTYFEHAYLASYLGYTLVQGDDLVMRDGSLWLKTLEGLQPVDILLRRVDAEYCDPLELKRDSFLGIAGLLGAMRNGRAACVNHPGTGVLENRGLLPFLPGLCRTMLGEAPILPAAATWWCGQPKERSHVLANLREMVIKPIHRNSGIKSVYGWLCGREELEKLRARILAQPMQFVGQEQIGFSSTPLLLNGKMVPRRSVLRAFACATTEGYAVMPGGLARSAAEEGSHRVSLGEGGILKDVWVLSDKSETHRSLWLESAPPRDAAWFGGVFTSRSADHLFWVGRYAERIARQVRLLRGMGQIRGSMLEDEEVSAVVLERMATLMEQYCGLPEPEEASPGLEDRMLRALREEDAAGSVLGNLHSLLYAAYGVRDIWSQDSWRILTGIEEAGKHCCRDISTPFALGEDLDELTEKLYAFYGLNSGGMTRESGWAMLMLGRTLESGLGLCDLVEKLVLPGHDPKETHSALMDGALSLNENLITYRRHYRTTPQISPVLDLMLAMDINPRSLTAHVAQTVEILQQLPPPNPPEALDALILQLKQHRARIGNRDWRTPEKPRGPGPLFNETRALLEQCSVAVTSAYFNHTATRALEAY